MKWCVRKQWMCVGAVKTLNVHMISNKQKRANCMSDTHNGNSAVATYNCLDFVCVNSNNS